MKLNQIGRRFALSELPGIGVASSEAGVFVGSVPLLERHCSANDLDRWQPRTASDINRELGKCYGLPVDFDSRIMSLATIAQALNRGDLLHAQIATLHLQIPDPPSPNKLPQSAENIIDLALQLAASGLLKSDWDPTKHPRWPAGSPDSTGGQFAPVSALTQTSATQEPNAQVIPAQGTIPAPLQIPGRIPFPSGRIPFWPQRIPSPSEILRPPAIPNINPRDVPKNPYPDRPECEQEWAEAAAFCKRLLERGQLGSGDYRGMGRTLYECIMGQVSEDCGGNGTGVT